MVVNVSWRLKCYTNKDLIKPRLSKSVPKFSCDKILIKKFFIGFFEDGCDKRDLDLSELFDFREERRHTHPRVLSALPAAREAERKRERQINSCFIYVLR